MKNKKDKIIILLLVCALIAAIIYILLNFSYCGNNIPSAIQNAAFATDDEAVDYVGDKPTAKLKSGQKGIVIPGFDTLVFVANQESQKVNFFNPSENTCYFKMSLVVDNVTLWQSGNVPPGKGYYNIKIKPLSKGNYTAFLQIDCFKDDTTPLNSANVQITLEVI